MPNILNQTTEIINGLKYTRTQWDDGSETLEIAETPPQPPQLKITLSTAQTTVNTPVTATVAIQNPDGTTVPVSGTYHCPVIRRGDNAQKAFLTITLSNGTGSVSFSLPEPGVYTIDPNLIRPVPSAELPETIELLVTP